MKPTPRLDSRSTLSDPCCPCIFLHLLASHTSCSHMTHVRVCHFQAQGRLWLCACAPGCVPGPARCAGCAARVTTRWEQRECRGSDKLYRRRESLCTFAVCRCASYRRSDAWCIVPLLLLSCGRQADRLTRLIGGFGPRTEFSFAKMVRAAGSNPWQAQSLRSMS